MPHADEEPPPVPVTPVIGPALLLVAGPGGVFELDAAGKRIRTLSSTGADAARRMGDGRTVVLRPDGEVTMIGADGAETRLALVPLAFDSLDERLTPHPSSAADDDGTQRVYLSDQDGFWIDERTWTACLWLLDRNLNMADVAVDAAVDIATGAVEWQAKWMSGPATHSAGWSSRRCASKARPRAPRPTLWRVSADLPFGYNARTGWFGRANAAAGDRIRLGVTRDEFEAAPVAAHSTSGRWLIAQFPAAEGDYVYWSYLVLDRASGEVIGFDGTGEGERITGTHTLGASERTALTTLKVDAYGSTVVPFARTMVGEEPVRFLAEGLAQLGNVIVSLPEGRAFVAEGEVTPLSGARRGAVTEPGTPPQGWFLPCPTPGRSR